MARVWLFSCLLFTMAVYALTFEFNLIKVFPEVGRNSGVSMVSYGNQYALNASQARAMCLFLNITIATWEQVHTAHQHGLETCGYGWIDEQIAVIPRIVKSMKCGRNNIGLIRWRAPIKTPFHVFCFNLTDLENPLDITTPKVQTTTKTMTTTTVTSTSAPTTTRTVKNRVKTTPKVPAHKSTTQVSRLAPTTTTTTTHMVQSTTSFISTSPPPSPSPSSLPCPTSLSHLLPTSSLSLPSSFSPSPPLISFLSFTSSSLVSSPSQNTSNHIESPAGAISTALLVVLPLLAAAVAVCYYKTTRGVFPIQFWRRGQHNLKDDIETEMWRHTDSEMDLQDPQQREGGEENGDRKFTSDIIVSNPETTTNGP